MSDYTPQVEAAMSASPYIMARFVSFFFADVTVRLWTGVGPFVLGLETYTGMGDLGSIAPISDKSDLSAQRIQITISGLDPINMAELRDYMHQGTPVEIYEAQLTQDLEVVPDPYLIFVGEVDVMGAALGETMTISAQIDNFLSFIFRGPDGHRETAADQIALFPGDLGLNYCASVITDIPWGRINTLSASSAGGGQAHSATYVDVFGKTRKVF